MLKRILLRHWPTALSALLTAGLGLLLLHSPIGQLLVHWSYDLPFVLRRVQAPVEALMVYMDDESHERLAQHRNQPWDRSLHARLVGRLADAGARVVVFDVVFSDPDRLPERDAALAGAIRRHGRVILAADSVPAAYGQHGVKLRNINMPVDALRDALGNPLEDIGSAEMRPSADLAIRGHFHGQSDDLLASLSWVAARRAGVAVTHDDSTRFQERWVNYYGPPGTLPNLSYHLALDTNDTPAEVFRDRVVFVGARLFTLFAGDRKDEFRNPFSYWNAGHEFMSGVELQATTFLNLSRGDWLVRAPRWAEGWLMVLLGVALGAGLLRLRPWFASATAAAAMLVAAAVAWGLFQLGPAWFPWLVVVAQILFALLFAVVFNSFQLYVQKRLYEQTLGLYLSPKLVKKFSSNERFLKPGAEKQMLTILFSDIANFTSISEGLDSDELARRMNEYFQRAVSDCIHLTDGTVVKYIGDAIFAFWNAPDHQADHALRACRAGLAFGRQEPPMMNGQPLITRIGLHTGVANVGNFGSTERVDYTALGENINLASRMEGLNKYLGTRVLATGETCGTVAERVVTRYCGRFKLKGFEKVVEVHELIGEPGEAEVVHSQPWRESFAAALESFRAQRFSKAAAGFERTVVLHPDDGPARFYLRHIAELSEHPPGPDWTGEIELKEK